MITDVEPCSAAELSSQIAYLAKTPVRGIACCLQEGQNTLKKGVVRSLDSLADLKMEFGQIGKRKANAPEGQGKFRVREVMPLLRANLEEDGALLKAIQAFIEKDKLGEVHYTA
jgi:hypothetical protein